MNTVDRIDADGAGRELLAWMMLALRPAHARDSKEFGAYIEVYRKLIRDLRPSASAIRQAQHVLSTEWQKTTWPTPGQLGALFREAEPVERPPPDRGEGDHIKAVDDLWRSDQGRRAVAGGYCLEFQCFARDRGRLPNEAEEDRLHAQQIAFEGRAESYNGMFRAWGSEASGGVLRANGNDMRKAIVDAYNAKWALEHQLRREWGRWLCVEPFPIGGAR